MIKELCQRVPLETLAARDTIMGLQFETPVLDSLDLVFDRLGLKNRAVLIHTGELDPAIEASDYFDHLIKADEWVAGREGCSRAPSSLSGLRRERSRVAVAFLEVFLRTTFFLRSAG